MAKGKTLQAIVEIAGNVSPTLGKSIGDVAGKLGKVNVKAIAAGAAVGGIAVETTKAVFKAGKALEQLGESFDEAYDAIRIGTGATGNDLEKLKGSFEEVYKSVPTTMEDASKAIADYNTRLGVTGPTLEGISKQAIQVADMLGEDLDGVIESSSKGMESWNIDAEDMGNAMDYVFKAAQATGVGFSDLMGKAKQFAPQMQQLGFSFEESVALVGQLDKAGMNTGEVLGAMKKSVGALAKEGLSASEGIEKYSQEILNAKDMTEATTIASQIFGARAGSTMAKAIRDGTISVDSLTKSLQESKETIGGAADDTYDFKEKLQVFKQQAQVALEPLASSIFDSINDLMPVAAEAMEGFVPILEEVSQAIIPIVKGLAPKISKAVRSMLPQLLSIAKAVGTSLLPPVVDMVTSILPTALAVLGGLMPVISTVATAILPAVVQLLQAVLPIISQIAGTVLPMVASVIASVMPTVTSLIQMVLPAVIDIINQLTPVISQLMEAIRPILEAVASMINILLPPIITIIQRMMPVITAVSSILTTVLGGAIKALIPIIKSVTSLAKGIASVFATAFGGIAGVVKTPINAVIAMVNKALGAINKVSFTVPGWVPKIGGKHIGFSLPKIPMLASGGFTEGVSIAGEAGQEAVISFDPRYRSQNLEYWQQAGQRLGVDTALASDLLGLDDFSLSELAAENQTVIYDFSGMSYSPTVNTTGEDGEDIMQKLRQSKEEFFDWLEEWLKRKKETAYA